MNLIPLNTVYITYRPSTAATVTRVYYGVLMGVCRDLHDLVTSDNGGHYNVLEADTLVVDPVDTTTGFVLRGDALLDAAALENGAVKGGGVNILVSVSLTGLSYSNSDGGKLYYKVTKATDTYTISMYKTAAETYLVASGAATGTVFPLEITIESRNNTGIGGTISLASATSDISVASGNYFDCLITRADVLEPYEYPNYKTESLIDTDTINIYTKGSKYFAFAQETVGGSKDYRLLPLQTNKYDAFTMVSVLDTDASTVDITKATDTVTVDFGVPLLPGSVVIKFDTTAIAMPAWVGGATHETGDIIISGSDYYLCKTGGTAGAGPAEPTWVKTAVGAETTDNTVTWMYMGTTTKQVYVDVPRLGTDAINGTLRILADNGETTAVDGSDRFGLGTLTGVSVDYLAGVVSFTSATAARLNVAAAYSVHIAYAKTYEYVTDTDSLNNVMKYIQKYDYVLASARTHTGDLTVDGASAAVLSYAAASTKEFSVATMKTAVIDTDYRTITFQTKNLNKCATITGHLTNYSLTTLSGSIITLDNVLLVAPDTFSYTDTGTRYVDLRPVPYFGFALNTEANYTELEPATGIIEITTTGTELEKGTINFTNQDITIDTVNREDFVGTIVPAISAQASFASEGNFISGTLYVEYEAEIRNSEYLNQLINYDSTLFDTAEGAPLGPIDPRNELAYAAYHVSRITPTTQFYIMPVTSESTGYTDGMKILTNYREIVHVAAVYDGVLQSLDSWIDPNVTGAENSPEVARFRIGYSPAELKTQIDRVLASQAIAGNRYTISGGYTRFEATDTDIDFEETYAVAVGDTCVLNYSDSTTATFIISDVSGYIVTFSAIGTAPTTKAVTSIAIYKPLTSASQIAAYMDSIQNSENSYFVKVICETVPYTYTRVDTGAEATITLPRKFNTIFPFSLKISTPPHQPTTFIAFENLGFGLVSSSSTLFSRSDFETLVAAGYYVMSNDLGTAPYALRDVTCGVKGPNGELGGVLSKVTPVILYAKEIWDITRDFLGKYNVVSDVINMLGLKLSALANKYTTKKYQYLGTILYEATQPRITTVANGVRIDYSVKPQDAMISIDNYVTVEEKTS